MATSLPWHSSFTTNPNFLRRLITTSRGPTTTVVSFGRSDFDNLRQRVASAQLWKDAWRSANNGFEQILYETKKTAESIDRRYDVSRRLSAVAQSAAYRAREIDRDLEITQRWRSFTLDFSRDWPRYRKQLNDFMDTQLGKSIVMVIFLWFALSGWLFRILIFATWVLPIAGPLLIGGVANNLVIKGSCPACKRQFVGSKYQIIRCGGCGNIVWQPQGDFFSRGNQGKPRSTKSESDIIDVEFEEK